MNKEDSSLLFSKADGRGAPPTLGVEFSMKAETNHCKPNQPSTLGNLVGKLRIDVIRGDDCNGVASSRLAI